MAERSRAMGRGLAAILSGSAGAEETDDLRSVAVELISPNPRQPRRSFDEVSLQALADSLGESGMLQPVLLRPRSGGTFELIAGERRWRAAQLAGLERIPALVRPREDSVALELALVENMVREDLNPVEEARACATLVQELGLTREEVGRRVGRSRVAVSNLMRLLDLPDEVLELIEQGALSEGHGRALLLAAHQHDRRRLAREALSGGLSVRELERRARAATDDQRPDVSGPQRGSGAVHPDQQAAAQQIADALSTALGVEVLVRPRGGGYRVELAVGSTDEALALAQRLRPRAVA